MVGCFGDTSIAAALSSGLELVGTSSGWFRQADLVLVCDGIDEGTADEPALRAQACCHEAHTVTDLSTVEGKVASALFA